MDLTAFLQDLWKKTGKYDPLGHKVAEKVAQTDSRAMAQLGRSTGWKWLENQGEKNANDPSRALAHAAQIYAAGVAAPYLASGYGAGGSAAGAAANSGGLFGAGEGMAANATQQQLMQEAIQQQLAERAAQEAAAQTAQQSVGGLFSQVPGAGTEQTALLNAQTADFGGYGANMTAKAAMPAVKDAYAAGNMGTLDYMGNVAKADLAGANDPSVLASRFTDNLDRMAGKAGKQYAQSYAQNSLFGQQQRPQQPMPRSQPVQPPPQITSDMDKQTAISDFQAGRITADELRRRLGMA